MRRTVIGRPNNEDETRSWKGDGVVIIWLFYKVVLPGFADGRPRYDHWLKKFWLVL